MSTMNMPGFTADASLSADESLRAARGHYRSGRPAASRSNAVIPAIPKCENCDYILDQCEIHGWRPRAVCNACLFGNCYHEPPPPNPFPDPFGRPPRF
jgi:hypothetical protein